MKGGGGGGGGGGKEGNACRQIPRFWKPVFAAWLVPLVKQYWHVSIKGGIFGFDHALNETRAKKWKRGEEEGKEGNACRQIPQFWKPAFAAWLAPLVEQYWHVSIKGLFHSETSCMVRDTHLHAVVVYSGWQDLPFNARAFSFTSFETQSSSCDYIKVPVSGRLNYSAK